MSHKTDTTDFIMVETEINFNYSAANLTNLWNFPIATTDLTLAEENRSAEIFRLVHVIVRPILIIGGTAGNVLTLYITRRPSLKNVSTCFYMFLLALADTSKWVLYNVIQLQNLKIKEWIIPLWWLVNVVTLPYLAPHHPLSGTPSFHVWKPTCVWYPIPCLEPHPLSETPYLVWNPIPCLVSHLQCPYPTIFSQYSHPHLTLAGPTWPLTVPTPIWPLALPIGNSCALATLLLPPTTPQQLPSGPNAPYFSIPALPSGLLNPHHPCPHVAPCHAPPAPHILICNGVSWGIYEMFEVSPNCTKLAGFPKRLTLLRVK